MKIPEDMQASWWGTLLHNSGNNALIAIQQWPQYSLGCAAEYGALTAAYDGAAMLALIEAFYAANANGDLPVPDSQYHLITAAAGFLK